MCRFRTALHAVSLPIDVYRFTIFPLLKESIDLRKRHDRITNHVPLRESKAFSLEGACAAKRTTYMWCTGG